MPPAAPVPVPARNPFQCEKAAWVVRLEANAARAFEDAKRAADEPEALHGAPAAIRRMLREQPAIAARVATKGIDAAFLDAGDELAARSRAALNAPRDTSGREVLTPAERDERNAAAAVLRERRDSSKEAAKRQGKLDEAKPLGYGTNLDARSVVSIHAGLKSFADAAPTRMDILTDAGIGPDELADVVARRNRMAALMEVEAARRAGSVQHTAAQDRALLTLEHWVSTFRSRTRTALTGDETAQTLALGALPRSVERRGKHRLVRLPADKKSAAPEKPSPAPEKASTPAEEPPAPSGEPAKAAEAPPGAPKA